MPKKARIPLVAPVDLPDSATIFDYLDKAGVARKIIDIATAYAKVPMELREDAAQEIKTTWSQTKPNLAYKPGQIAAYAHRIAIHAALRLRRELGSAVRLPGSAFRQKSDGTTYVTPGALATALAWNDVEEWMHSDDWNPSFEPINQAAEASPFQLTIPAQAESDEDSETDRAVYLETDPDYVQKQRVQEVCLASSELTLRQRRIMDLLLAGEEIPVILATLDIKRNTLTKEHKIIKEQLAKRH